MKIKGIVLLVLVVVAVSACATIPAGPSVMVWPDPGKPFEVFQSDDAVCRQWASQQVGAKPGESAGKTLASGAVVGTILGAGLGAAIGAATGQFGVGLGIGAASGAIMGTAAGIGPSYGAGREVQRRYYNAYLQCMYAKGNQIPGAVRTSAPLQAGEVSGKSLPVITEAFASKDLIPGHTWKVYLKASDPDGDMQYIVSVVYQPGGGNILSAVPESGKRMGRS